MDTNCFIAPGFIFVGRNSRLVYIKVLHYTGFRRAPFLRVLPVVVLDASFGKTSLEPGVFALVFSFLLDLKPELSESRNFAPHLLSKLMFVLGSAIGCLLLHESSVDVATQSDTAPDSTCRQTVTLYASANQPLPSSPTSTPSSSP
jgi:hypothetical protein